MNRPLRIPSAMFATLALSTLLCGCHVSSQKNGKNDNVDIGTPFGSMQVKTNDNVAAAGVGISPYPGAQLQKKQDDGDSHAADINMSFGSFHLGVKAVTYVSPDAPDKIVAFYHKDLAKYGAVLQCNGSATVGQPTRTAEGLTCSDEHKGTHWDAGESAKTELRTGSKQHMHIVAVEPKDGQTKIGLIALDLPGNLSSDSGKNSD